MQSSNLLGHPWHLVEKKPIFTDGFETGDTFEFAFGGQSGSLPADDDTVEGETLVWAQNNDDWVVAQLDAGPSAAASIDDVITDAGPGYQSGCDVLLLTLDSW